MPAPQVTPWINLGALQHALKHLFTGAHLPQHVHVQTAFAAAHVVGDARLADRRPDRVADQLLVALQAGLAAVDQRDQVPALVDAVAVDAREGADPPVAAQAPLLRPLEIEIPLPPSISGHTSRPLRIRGLERSPIFS